MHVVHLQIMQPLFPFLIFFFISWPIVSPSPSLPLPPHTPLPFYSACSNSPKIQPKRSQVTSRNTGHNRRKITTADQTHNLTFFPFTPFKSTRQRKRKKPLSSQKKKDKSFCSLVCHVVMLVCYFVPRRNIFPLSFLKENKSTRDA